MSESIFSNAAVIHTSTTIASGFDAKLLAIAGNERELGAAFAALPIGDRRTLASRLSKPHAGDRLAETFCRLAADRRARLINVLDNASRER